MWKERDIDKLISKLARFSISGNTRLNSKTWYLFFTSPLSNTLSLNTKSPQISHNSSNYTRLSRTCNSSEVFRAMGESGTLRETPGSSSSGGLHSSHPSLPRCSFVLQLLPIPTATELKEDSTTKWQEIFQNADTEVWLWKVRMEWKQQLKFQDDWVFLERPKKLFQSHCQINKNTKLHTRVGESLINIFQLLLLGFVDI